MHLFERDALCTLAVERPTAPLAFLTDLLNQRHIGSALDDTGVLNFLMRRVDEHGGLLIEVPKWAADINPELLRPELERTVAEWAKEPEAAAYLTVHRPALQILSHGLCIASRLDAPEPYVFLRSLLRRHETGQAVGDWTRIRTRSGLFFIERMLGTVTQRRPEGWVEDMDLHASMWGGSDASVMKAVIKYLQAGQIARRTRQNGWRSGPGGSCACWGPPARWPGLAARTWTPPCKGSRPRQ